VDSPAVFYPLVADTVRHARALNPGATSAEIEHGGALIQAIVDQYRSVELSGRYKAHRAGAVCRECRCLVPGGEEDRMHHDRWHGVGE
jgi:hypothetical protein